MREVKTSGDVRSLKLFKKDQIAIVSVIRPARRMGLLQQGKSLSSHMYQLSNAVFSSPFRDTTSGVAMDFAVSARLYFPSASIGK